MSECVCESLTMCPRYFHFSSFLRWQMSNCNFSCPCFRLFIEYPCWWSNKSFSLYLTRSRFCCSQIGCRSPSRSLTRSLEPECVCMKSGSIALQLMINSKFTLILRKFTKLKLALPQLVFVRVYIYALFMFAFVFEFARSCTIRCCFYLLGGWITIAFIIQMYQIAWNALRANE